jgi:predicted RNA methylase
LAGRRTIRTTTLSPLSVGYTLTSAPSANRPEQIKDNRRLFLKVQEEAVKTRHEGRVKMWYYPTLQSVVYRIRSFLRFPAEKINVLDPCCGEGAAVHNLVEGANVATYGIELDEYRAKQAKGMLDYVLHCGYEDVRISNDAFSCLFLNPPYDWQGAGQHDENRHERTEKTFLSGTVRYVMPEGVLVYIVHKN